MPNIGFKNIANCTNFPEIYRKLLTNKDNNGINRKNLKKIFLNLYNRW